MSFILCISIVIRSIPIPKANPLYLFGEILQFLKTLGFTMPQPKISNQPVFLHVPQPLPAQIKHEISISALGSVNGK